MRSILPLMLALCAGGCGYKGPLYFPEAKPGVKQPGPAIAPEPAPDRPVPAQSAPPPR
jgi:predicted small lipoprotein YifL